MDTKTKDGEVVFFTKTIRLKNGRILVAAAFGLKAFRCVRKLKK